MCGRRDINSYSRNKINNLSKNRKTPSLVRYCTRSCSMSRRIYVAISKLAHLLSMFLRLSSAPTVRVPGLARVPWPAWPLPEEPAGNYGLAGAGGGGSSGGFVISRQRPRCADDDGCCCRCRRKHQEHHDHRRDEEPPRHGHGLSAFPSPLHLG